QRRYRPVSGCVNEPRGQRKRRAGSILVHRGREQVKVAGGKAAEQRGADVQLTSRLILRAIERAGVAPLNALQIGVQGFPDTSPDSRKYSLHRRLGRVDG